MRKTGVGITMLMIFKVCFFSATAGAQPASRLRYLDENAAGARGAMGLLAHGYARAIVEKAGGYRLALLPRKLLSGAISALSYQIVSFESERGIAVQPLRFRKSWRGFWEGYLGAEGIEVFFYLLKRYDSMKFAFGSTFAMAMGIMVIEGEGRQTWRYANDGPLTWRSLLLNENAYWIHFAGSGGLYWAISRNVRSKELALLYTMALIWLWEVKDGYLWWEDVGFWGGEGFSWADGWAGTIAAVGSYGLSKLLAVPGSRLQPKRRADIRGLYLRPGPSGLRLVVSW